MTQHTPGPITLDYEPTGFGSGKLLLDGEHGPELIGTMNGQGRYNYGQELVIRHNAYPAMLEALREALEFTNRFGHPNGCTYMKSDHINDCDCGYAYDQIEAAIAAAGSK